MGMYLTSLFTCWTTMIQSKSVMSVCYNKKIITMIISEISVVVAFAWMEEEKYLTLSTDY